MAAAGPDGRPDSGTIDPGTIDPGTVVIGLVNNMPDAALRRTEGQFRALLGGTPPGPAILVKSFYLPEVPRSDRAKMYLEEFHQPIGSLWDNPVDGLIVTGTEPRAPVLTEEPYWRSLTALVDWARDNTVSTIWSCLAAHAAVLHLDGIQRRKLGGKLSGVFECRKVSPHPLLAGIPASWHVPHSRYNGLPEARLAARGYQMLSAGEGAGADIFVRQRASLFVFLQGHPEYDRFALFREYRRDIIRFLAGERDDYPDMPAGYFDDETAMAMAAFRRRALCRGGGERAGMLDSLPADINGASIRHAWYDTAVAIFANWVSHLAARKLPGYVPGMPLAAGSAMQLPAAGSAMQLPAAGSAMQLPAAGSAMPLPGSL
jgi:homoserine O-succinyltransferase